MPLLTDWTLSIDPQAVFRQQQVDPAVLLARKPALYRLTERALAEAPAWLHPLAIYRRLDVQAVENDTLRLENGAALHSLRLARRLKLAQTLLLGVVTIGSELEAHASQAMQQGQAALGYLYDSIGTVALEALASQWMQRMEAEFAPQGLHLSHRFSPGLPSWSVPDGQAELFALLPETAGRVRLEPGGQMLPLKSLSFVVGIGEKIHRRGTQCRQCSAYATCTYRTQG